MVYHTIKRLTFKQKLLRPIKVIIQLDAIHYLAMMLARPHSVLVCRGI